MLGVGGAPSGFFFFGGALACSGLYSWRERESKRRLDRGHWGGDNLGVWGFWSNLKGGPVHVHPRPVVVAEPLQILLCVCSQDCALQLSVYCGIAEERKIEQIVRI